MDKDEIIKALATALVDVADGLALSLLGGGPIPRKATTKCAESACNRKRMFA